MIILENKEFQPQTEKLECWMNLTPPELLKPPLNL